MASGLTGFEALLFVIAGIFALMLIFGYRTRLAMIVSWFLLISLHVRNPMVLQGGDVLFRSVLFWMMFLPLGRVWSLDRLFNRVPQPTKETVFSAATVAYIIQICLLYVFTGLLKTGTAWHDGTAVYYALNVDQLIAPVGMILREFPGTMSVLTYVTWYIEMYGVLLFFSPVATGFFRTLGVFVFACLQIGFNSSMRLGLFGAIAIVVTLGLLPPGFWNDGWNRFTDWVASKGKKGLTVYYDFECSFCYKTSFFMKRVLLLHPETEIKPAHTDPTIEAYMMKKNSWVITDEKGSTYTSWGGAVALVRHSPIFFWTAPILSLPFMNFFGEKLYAYLSHKRKQVCIPEPTEEEPAGLKKAGMTIVTLVVIFLTFYVVAWNLDTLGNSKQIIPPQLLGIGWFTHLDQKFNMFAPTPLTEDGWYVFPGKLADGTAVDVFTGKEGVSYAKPEWVAYMYKNQRWQKYLMNLWGRDFSEYRLGYGKFLCRQWNASHSQEKQLVNYDMIFMLETTPPPGQMQTPVVPTTIWNHSCI
jgi:hypothetical protein